MIYFYTVRLCFWKNNERILKDYRVDFLDMPEFLWYHQQKNSTMEIYWIKPYYRGNNFYD